MPPAALPELYATTRRGLPGRGAGGIAVRIDEAARVRVINVGKAGDVGVTSIMDETKRDQARLAAPADSDPTSRLMGMRPGDKDFEQEDRAGAPLARGRSPCQ